MAREWTDDEVLGEIRKALDIFREDHVVKRIGALEEKLLGGIKPPADDDTEGKPPPAKPPKDSAEKPKRSLWWGDQA